MGAERMKNVAPCPVRNDDGPHPARHVVWETTVLEARSDEDALVAAVSALFGPAHRMLHFAVMTESGPMADFSVDKEIVMDALGKEAV